MTSEEIKERYSMEEIVGRYGYRPNRVGFIPCPFHKEKTASMKIYKDSYNCFGCGANGDVFTFVQQMEHMDFKEAFYELGGQYPEHNKQEGKFSQRRRKKKMENAAKTKQNKEKRINRKIAKLCKEIDLQRKVIQENKPYIDSSGEAIFPDEWCRAVNRFENAYNKFVYLYEKREGG